MLLDFPDYAYAELGYCSKDADGDQNDNIGHTICRDHEYA